MRVAVASFALGYCCEVCTTVAHREPLFQRSSATALRKTCPGDLSSGP